MNDLSDLSDKRLRESFDYLANLRDEAQDGMSRIREEQARRRDAEIEQLQAQVRQEPSA